MEPCEKFKRECAPSRLAHSRASVWSAAFVAAFPKGAAFLSQAHWSSALFWLQVITLEGWVEIMYYVMDAHSFYNFIYFILLIIVRVRAAGAFWAGSKTRGPGMGLGGSQGAPQSQES